MFKLFKKIRQNLLSQNRVSKYFVYAIGEICLVVIGILIAVQINNWNTERNLKKEELKTLVSIKNALELNLQEFQNTLQQQTSRLKSVEQILFSDLSVHSAGELDNTIGISSDNYTFNPSLGILETMIYSGKLELISNDSLKKGISKLRDRFSDYQEEEERAAQITRDYLHPYFMDSYNIDPEILSGLRNRTESEENRDKLFYLKAVTLPRVKNMYFLLLDNMFQITLEGKQLETELQNLVSSIKLEIETQTKNN